MHPGPVGHFMLARNIAEQLRKRGWAISLPYQLSISEKSRAEKIRWLLRNGTPWFLKRSVDLLPAALILMLFELYNVTKELINPKSNNAELKILNHIQSIDANSKMLKAS
jgi:UDP-N-acetylglucosamine:LPS N-acetylglucosamine transferase